MYTPAENGEYWYNRQEFKQMIRNAFTKYHGNRIAENIDILFDDSDTIKVFWYHPKEPDTKGLVRGNPIMTFHEDIRTLSVIWVFDRFYYTIVRGEPESNIPLTLANLEQEVSKTTFKQ